MVQPLWKTVWQFFKDLELEIPFDPVIPLLDIYPKDYKLFYHKDTCTRNKPKCPSVIDWTKKIWHIHSMEYYAAIKMMSLCPL